MDDHHFKDEFLFYRFKNDDKQKSPKFRERLALRKSSKRQNDETGSQGDPSENRASGGSWDSSSGEVNTPPKRATPELEE